MEQANYTITRKKHKHILRDDRYVIEQMLAAGQEETAIVKVIGCTVKTLRREIERGTHQYLDGATYEFREKYSWDVGQRKHEEKGGNKGRYARINNEPEFRVYLENKIKKEKYSPEAALLAAEADGLSVK